MKEILVNIEVMLLDAIAAHQIGDAAQLTSGAFRELEKLQRERDGLKDLVDSLIEAAEFIERTCDVSDVPSIYPCPTDELNLRAVKNVSQQMVKVAAKLRGGE